MTRRQLGRTPATSADSTDVQPSDRIGREARRYGAHADAESYIEDLVQQWRGCVSETDGEVLRDPIGAATAIRLHLGQRPAGLVAMTTHARSGVKRALLGAAAASIVHASVAPCLVAPVRR